MSTKTDAPICGLCKRSGDGIQFQIFTPRFQPFGTACVDCEAGIKKFTYDSDFKEYLRELDAGKVVEIDDEMFSYWLEVLPPVYMNGPVLSIAGLGPRRCSFGFREGDASPSNPVTHFWKEGGKLYAWSERRKERTKKEAQ